MRAYRVRAADAVRELIYFERADLVGDLLDGMIPCIDTVEEIWIRRDKDISEEIARELVRLSTVCDERIRSPASRLFVAEHYDKNGRDSAEASAG